MKVVLCSVFLLFSAWCSAAPTELDFWHSFAGELGNTLQHLVDEFNQTHKDIRVKTQYKGDYLETLTSFAAAKQAGKTPAMVQVFEVGTSYMLHTPDLVQPVDALMAKHHSILLKNRLLPGVANYYTRKGTLQAYPLNVSLPVMFYNVDAMKKIGYNPTVFPSTWQSFEVFLSRLAEKEKSCGYTTAYPAWIHHEVFAGMHHISLKTKKSPSVVFESEEAFQVHWRRLSKWHKKGWMAYGGRNSDATSLFTSGRCATFTQSSGSYESLKAIAPFEVGMTAIPVDSRYRKDTIGAVFGGAAIWVVAQQSEQQQAAVARFLAFMSAPEQQWRWHQMTGYIPMMAPDVFVEYIPSGCDSVLALAYQAFNAPGDRAYNMPINQFRAVLDQALERIFSGQASVREAIHLAQRQMDYRYKRYRQNYHQ